MNLEPTTAAHVVVAAKVTIQHGDVRVEDQMPNTIRLNPGEKLHLDLLYKFDESDKEKEQFEVALRSRLGDNQAPDTKRVLRDHPFLPDEEWGRIRQVYEAPETGEHDLFVDIEASYCHGPWAGKDKPECERYDVTHHAKVLVQT